VSQWLEELLLFLHHQLEEELVSLHYQHLSFSAAFAVAANIPSIRIPATKIGKIIIAIGLCTMSCKNDYNLIKLVLRE
jgi:hypothetical protein